MSIRVALADGHPIVLDGLEWLLGQEADFVIVARCQDGETALRAVRELRPDLLVLDLSLPRSSGITVLRQIRSEQLPTLPVLLTAALGEDEVVEVLRLGVRGVVLKEMPSRLLVQCLRKVQAGERWLELRSTAEALDHLMRQPDDAPEPATGLTPRELETVRWVAQGLHNKEIAARLSITEGTVKVHVHNAYAKLRVTSRVALMRWAQGQGLA